MTYIPVAQTSGGFPAIPDTVYTAAGAITLTDTFALLQPGSGFTEAAPMAMTLQNGTAGKTIVIKVDGPGVATITGNFDRVSGTKLTLFSPNGRGALWLLWNVAASTYFVMNQFDPGKLRADLPNASTLAGTDLSDVTQSGTDVKTNLAAVAQFSIAQSLPTVPLTATTTLSFAAHNKRKLYCSSSLTLVVPSAATLTEGFFTTVLALGTANVSLSGTVVDLSGAPVLSVPAGSSATLEVCSGVIYCDRRTAAATTSTALLINSISGQTPGGTSTASLSFAGGAPATLTATSDGAGLSIANVTITTVSGTGATAAGTASFTFTTPSAGTHVITASSTGTYATLSNAYSFATSTTPILAVSSVAPVGAGVVNAVAAGTFSNGAPASLTATMDGSALTIASPVITTASGSGATAAGTWSFTLTNPATGSHQLVVSGTGTYAATSTAYAYSTAATTLVINNITAPAPNTSLTIGGSYSNWTPTGLQYSTNTTNGIDGFWTTATSPVIFGGTFVFTISGGLAAGSYTLWVRGLTNPQIATASNAFVITATGGTIAAPTGTQVGTASLFPITVTGTGLPTVYASITSGGVEQTPRTSVPFGSTSIALRPTAAAASTASLYLASSGGTALATSGSFTPIAGASGYPVLTTSGVNRLSIYDPAVGVTVTSGVITAVADQSGNGNGLTSTIGPLLGAAVNGTPGFAFSGANYASNTGLRSSGAWVASMSGQSTILLAMQTGSSIPVNGIVFNFEPAALNFNDDFWLRFVGGNLQFGRRGSNGFSITRTILSPVVINTVYKIALRFAASPTLLVQPVFDYWINAGTKVSETLSNPGGNCNVAQYAIGQAADPGAVGTYSFQGVTSGEVLEMHNIQGLLSDADVATYLTYYTTRWG